MEIPPLPGILEIACVEELHPHVVETVDLRSRRPSMTKWTPSRGRTSQDCVAEEPRRRLTSQETVPEVCLDHGRLAFGVTKHGKENNCNCR
ncbi:hypothetical protein BHE74_00027911 [Ensete ventricosum]|nr:hypothetical protein BHE74_00027911 [Ensete ventricosum]RZS29266.1 hypothetical protein BHM03_00062975 [Ensete ventricosum]